MKIDSIISKRNFQNWPSWDLVYEWEDILSEYLSVKLIRDTKLKNKYLRKFPLADLLFGRKNKFVFDMHPRRHNTGENSPRMIPCIIDFFLRDTDQLKRFYKAYDRCVSIFISSKEVFEFLKDNKCPLPINHLALSISDKFKITQSSKYEKKYDLVLMGRQNKRQDCWLKEYEKKHPDLYYVYRKLKNGRFDYYTNRDEFLGDINTRNKYIDLMRQSRIALYATPGIEGDPKNTNGFHQITPRFLEYVSCACHIIASYIPNSDTDYFEINRFSPNISSYEEFESLMDNYRTKDVDIKMYSDYLKRHYTSRRAYELKQIIDRI